MEKRTSPVVYLVVAASLWMLPTVRAQDLYVTNLDQFVAEAYSPDYCVVLPFSPWDWRAFSLYGGEPWWLDCSQMSCDGLFQTSTELSAGVPAYTVVLLQNVLTGETIIQPDGSTDVVASVEAPSGYQPVMTLWNSWMWNWYEQAVDQPDSWGLSAGEVPPPVITLRALLADVSNYAAYAAYESNLEAEAEAEQAAQAATASMSGGFMAMDEDDDDGGGDPCTLTSLTQPFYVTNIVRNASGSTTITWQSCQFFRYLVFSANSLSTNTQWVPQAYVWGATNASLTTWTDTATTNNDGSTVTQRFYRVQRLLGSPIAAGGLSSVALRQDGTLWAWGTSEGELGDGLDNRLVGPNDNNVLETYLPFPTDVANVTACGVQAITNPVAIAAGGDDYTVVVDATGTVWTFGENDGGQLGNSSYNQQDIPFPISGVPGFTNVVSVAAGYQHTLALCADGTVWAWGNDCYGPKDRDNNCQTNGALGLGNFLSNIGLTSTNTPFQSLIPTGTVIVAIAAGDGFSLAVDKTGQVWGWGDNEYGEIGTGVASGVGTLDGINTPILVQGISNVIAIATGANGSSTDQNINGGGHSIALTADKRVWTWGDNEFGELGRNTGTFDPAPAPVPNLTNVVAIAGGVGFTLAATGNGQVYAWGDNSFGELGTTTSAVASTNRPMLVGGISNVVWVSAPRSDDNICDVLPPPVAICVHYGSGAQYEYVGGVHSLAMTLDPVDGTGQMTNHYWGWGDNTYGQVGNDISGGATNQISQYAPAGPVQFCTRCQREVQLGSMGAFEAQCSGTLYLYFNTDEFGYPTGAYNATVNGYSNVTVWATNNAGVAVGTVTIGNVYTFSSSGSCAYDSGRQLFATPDGTDTVGSNSVDCSASSIWYVNPTNSICPALRCYSLVGKIQ
jgi:alpha-tubulin suppressor-like RCC1 family protein